MLAVDESIGSEVCATEGVKTRGVCGNSSLAPDPVWMSHKKKYRKDETWIISKGAAWKSWCLSISTFSWNPGTTRCTNATSLRLIFSLLSPPAGGRDGSAGRGDCCQAWRPVLDPWDLAAQWEEKSSSHSLSSGLHPWTMTWVHPHYINKQMNERMNNTNNKNIFKKKIHLLPPKLCALQELLWWPQFADVDRCFRLWKACSFALTPSPWLVVWGAGLCMFVCFAVSGNRLASLHESIWLQGPCFHPWNLAVLGEGSRWGCRLFIRRAFFPPSCPLPE